jgi:N-acetylmuramoyl-L-alanine amidase
MRPVESIAADRLQNTGEDLVIVIDPGHGGDNLGTEEGYRVEKEITMVTARALAEELSKYENVVVLLTHTEDTDMSLKERAEYSASVGADFLFSIHYNASVNHDLYGSEVWISQFPPYNAYGYQFGMVMMQEFQDMGLFLRGVKTKAGKDDLDYYGIIRESRELQIPAVIIEHCHVDQYRDQIYLGTDEQLENFGRADATAIARYFGLKSAELGVDYSRSVTDDLPMANEDQRQKLALQDTTEPEVCTLEFLESDEEAATASFSVSAADYDGLLLYYDYSTDGGYTWSERYPWPGLDIFRGVYDDTFRLDLCFEPGDRPYVLVRAYNQYDLFTVSNDYQFTRSFPYPEVPEEEPEPEEAEFETVETPGIEESSEPSGLAAFFEARMQDAKSGDAVVSIRSFLILALLVVGILFLILLSVHLVLMAARPSKYRKSKKAKRKRK